MVVVVVVVMDHWVVSRSQGPGVWEVMVVLGHWVGNDK